VPLEELESLARDSDVDSVSIDADVTSTDAADQTTAPPDSTLVETLGLDDVAFTGKDIGIAVIDSGLERNHDLDRSRDEVYDFTASGRKVKAFDDYGHGTHVAGLISGTGELSKTKVLLVQSNGSSKWVDKRLYRGVAPDARIVSLKVLDASGSGQTSHVIEAIEFAIANRKQLGIDIINLSLGHPVYEPPATDPLVRVVEKAAQAGIVVIAAAGNYGVNPQTGGVGYAGITSPGNAPSAITVGALNTRNTVSRLDDEVAAYSSRGPTWYSGGAKPDIVAPGHALISDAAIDGALYKQLATRRVSTSRNKEAPYLRLSGTSMAAAVTSGVVARMLEAHERRFHRSLPSNAVKAFLEYSAFTVANADALTQGAGALNGAGAVALATSADPSTPSGAWWLADGVEPATSIDGVTLPWSQSILWGTTIVGGTSVYYNLPAWSQSILWGTGNLSGNSILWGTNVVWDNPSTWASAIVWGHNLLQTTDGTSILWGTANHVDPTSILWGTIDWRNAVQNSE